MIKNIKKITCSWELLTFGLAKYAPGIVPPCPCGCRAWAASMAWMLAAEIVGAGG